MRKRVYISSTISNDGKIKDKQSQLAYVQFAMNAAEQLFDAGFAPLVPHLTFFHRDQFTSRMHHEEWMQHDLPWVAVCDAVLRLPGESRGADVECSFAASLSIPVFTSLGDLTRHFYEGSITSYGLPPEPLIVGLGHYSRTGKSTFARYLRNHLQIADVTAEIVGFASKLKDVCHQLYGWAGLHAESFYEKPENEHLRTVVLPELGKSPVDIWVDFGTNAVRNNVYDRTWIDVLLNGKHDCEVLIIQDTRFPNECGAIRDRNGILIKIVRPGVEPKNTPADQALVGYDGWDYVFGGTALSYLDEGAEFIADLLIDKLRCPAVREAAGSVV